MLKKLRAMGALRNLLHVTALLFTLLIPFARVTGYSDNWQLFFSGVVPATAPIILIVIMLDIMMSQIWKSDAPTERITQLNDIIRAHIIVAAILLTSFLVVFLPVLLP